MQPRAADYREHITSTVAAVLAACDPRACVGAALAAHPARFKKPGVMAIGKAAAGMYEGWCAGRGKPEHALMVVPRGSPGPEWAIASDHPVPGQASVDAGLGVEGFIRDARASKGVDGFVVLLSGGSSALVTAPADGLGLPDVAEVTRALLGSGASINEFNRVRKHIDRLKGGRMAALMAPLPVDAYVLSDVHDGDVSSVGSGPVLPDGSTYQGALDVLRERSIDVPSVIRHLTEGAAGKHPETPKFGDPVFSQVRCILVASNRHAVEAARVHLASLGFEEVQSRWGPLSGDAGRRGHALAGEVGSQPATRPCFIVTGGETTVKLSGSSGVGGRNQEFVLAAALQIDGRNNLAVASFGTDGVDGPTDAAGAFVTGETCRQARSIGLDPAETLARHDSHRFFCSLERAGYPHLIRTGPTGTNVNDVAVALAY